MKSRIARHASLILVGAMLLLVVPVSSAFAGLDSISSLSPSMAPPGVTTSVTVHGNFLFAPSSFGFVPSTGITINSTNPSGSDYILSITIASNAPTTQRDVTETDLSGSSTCSKCFTITPPPTITSVAPTTLAAGAGPINYTITGTGFLANPTVSLSNNATNSVNVGTAVMSGNGTIITVPLTAASNTVLGTRDVTVTNTDGQSDKLPSGLTITPPPSAGLIFPAQRAAGLTNQQIDIIGAGFNPTTSVSFSGGKITVSTTTFINSTHMRLTISVNSNATPAAVDVTFDNSDNGGHSVCSHCFAITGPTTISITTPSTVNGSIVATFSQPVSGLSSSNSFVRYTGKTSNLPTIVICVNQDGGVVSCATGYVKQAVLRPTSLITPGQHYTVHIASASNPPVVDFGGLTVAEQTQGFPGGLVQPGEGPATFLAWRAVRTSAAYGGSYVVDDVAGASASYRFTGSSIIWYTNIGPSYGIADLYIDGVKRAVVNSYSATTHYRAAFTVSGFSYGAHTLTVRVRGAKGSSHGTGTNVAIDAFSARGILVSAPSLSYVWGTVSTVAALGNLYSWANEPGASASFTFRGTSIEWDTVTGPQMGLCKVYVDGVLKATVNNYSAALTYHVKKMFTGLTDTVHSIRIIVSGIHQAASSGSFIVVDGWVVT